MDDARRPVGKVDAFRESVDCLHRLLAQRRARIRPLEGLDDHGHDEVEILLDVRTKSLQGVENLHLRAHALVRELAFEDLQKQGYDVRQEGLELGVQCTTQSFHEGHYRQLQRGVLPEIRNEREDVRHVVPNMLLDDPDQDCELLQMEFLQTRYRCPGHGSKGGDDLYNVSVFVNAGHC